MLDPDLAARKAQHDADGAVLLSDARADLRAREAVGDTDSPAAVALRQLVAELEGKPALTVEARLRALESWVGQAEGLAASLGLELELDT